MHQVRTILHPTDFSPGAMVSLKIARSLAHNDGAKLVILGVVPPSPELVQNDSGQIAGLPHHLEALASAIVDVPVAYQIANGDPGAVIVEVASKIHANLIVMGMQGRGKLPWMTMGSVAEYVTRHARCPVLTATTGLSGQAATVPAPDESSAITLTDFEP